MHRVARASRLPTGGAADPFPFLTRYYVRWMCPLWNMPHVSTASVLALLASPAAAWVVGVGSAAGTVRGRRSCEAQMATDVPSIVVGSGRIGSMLASLGESVLLKRGEPCAWLSIEPWARFSSRPTRLTAVRPRWQSPPSQRPARST